VAQSTAGSPFAERPTALVVPDAYRFVVPLVGVAGLAGFFGVGWLAGSCGAAALFVLAFFRNPARPVPTAPGLVVAPADGKVVAVEEGEDSEGRKGLRIGIFLSVFDVHINRAPVAGRVRALRRGGECYLAAFRPSALHHNVHLTMELETERGAAVAVSQITGWVARRIVCHPRVGERLERGQRYGLIHFGSRTDVFLPLGSRPQVALGDRVRGGQSVVAELVEGR